MASPNQLLITDDTSMSTKPLCEDMLSLAPGKLIEIQNEVWTQFGRSCNVHGVGVAKEEGQYFIDITGNTHDIPDLLALNALGGRKLRVRAVQGSPVKPWML